MSTLIAIALVLVLLLTEHLRSKKREVPVFLQRYLHPGHTWMRQTEDGEIVVGIDEFASGVLGGVDSIALPRYLKKMHQGEPSFTLSRSNRSIKFVSPVTGRVIQKNEMVMRDPSLVVSSPLRDGWLFKVHPTSLLTESRNLLSGRWASRWNDAARAHLLRFFSLSPVAVAQDGGVISRDLALQCTDKQWEELNMDLFLNDVHAGGSNILPLPRQREEVLQ